MDKRVNLPISLEAIRDLKVGDAVLLNGVMITGRDAVHKWLTDTYLNPTKPASQADLELLEEIRKISREGVIYHCGPVVSQDENKEYHFVSAGPTTSIREEPYQAGVMELLGLRGVIGKGGMGARTLEACQALGGVYFHAIGGAAAYIAQSVSRVLGVHKLDLGVPEAIWVIEVVDFPAVVTMDAHGNSLHKNLREQSAEVLANLMR